MTGSEQPKYRTTSVHKRTMAIADETGVWKWPNLGFVAAK